ncbi:MAG: hypothetical protein HYT94_01450, partial [Parcubacteria group bacterium]|nr:hypothetical protein [Parcubacteria group bacterium]
MKKSLQMLLASIFLLCESALSSAAIPIYTDTLAPGWSDVSYDTVRNYCANPASSGHQSGACALSVQYSYPWAGFAIQHSGISTTGNNTFSFLIHGTSPTTPEVYLTLFGTGGARLGSVLISTYIPGGAIGS